MVACNWTSSDYILFAVTRCGVLWAEYVLFAVHEVCVAVEAGFFCFAVHKVWGSSIRSTRRCLGPVDLSTMLPSRIPAEVIVCP